MNFSKTSILILFHPHIIYLVFQIFILISQNMLDKRMLFLKIFSFCIICNLNKIMAIFGYLKKYWQTSSKILICMMNTVYRIQQRIMLGNERCMQFNIFYWKKPWKKLMNWQKSIEGIATGSNQWCYWCYCMHSTSQSTYN